MDLDQERDAIVRSLKRKPMELGQGASRVRFGKEEIRRIIPHRPPMELVDTIEGLDLEGGMIEATSLVPADSPLFAGHFPGNPVYPGVYQVETMGQAALCLAHFMRNRTAVVASDAVATGCLFTRIHNASFQELVGPGDCLTVLVKILDVDDCGGLMAAQIISGGRVCSHSILEAVFT